MPLHLYHAQGQRLEEEVINAHIRSMMNEPIIIPVETDETDVLGVLIQNLE